MTRHELLQATGNAWKLTCWDNGNRRRVVRVLYVRAETKEKALTIGHGLSDRRCIDAVPYDPRHDRAVFGWIVESGS